jgi:hypothetical protein
MEYAIGIGETSKESSNARRIGWTGRKGIKSSCANRLIGDRPWAGIVQLPDS